MVLAHRGFKARDDQRLPPPRHPREAARVHTAAMVEHLDEWPEVTAWRRAERERLIAERLAVPADTRARMARRIVAALDQLDIPPHSAVGIYWPFRGEFDLREWAISLLARNIQPALPVVVERNRPMIFRPWRPGCRMERGVWNIPVPAEGQALVPGFVIAPLVGYDQACFRLGYGGGYFDRTLAVLSPRPVAVGIGVGAGRLPSIRPQPHDIPMDRIITEELSFAR